MAETARDLVVEPLARAHRRAAFRSGEPTLDRYLERQAGQDVRRRANGVFVLRRADDDGPARDVLGYYTLCATALAPGDVPEAARRHVPRYPLVSATLLGRLAVALDVQGGGLGGVLLGDALCRAARTAETVGACMVVADAIDDGAAEFYAAHGFVRLPDGPRMVLPMRMIAA